MEMPLQLAAGALVIAGSAVLAHFLHTAINAPEKMNLGLVHDREHTTGSRIYLGLVVASWAAFAFSGAAGLLSWLPGYGHIGAAGLIAFMSLFLLTHIERAAYAKYALRRSTLIRQEMEQLIRYSAIPNAVTIEGYANKAKSAEPLAEREAYAEIARLAALLAERENMLCSNAVSQAQREAEELAQQQETAARKAQEAATKQARLNQFRQALEECMAPLPSTKTLEGHGARPAAMLEPSLVKQKWKPLSDFAERLRQSGTDANITALLGPVAGLRLLNDADFELILHGNERDGHYEIRSRVGDTWGDLADGLIFEPSLDGAIAAFYLRAVLPGRLAWGHGMYDRDQQFVASLEQAIGILDTDRVKPDAPELQKVTGPPGLRVTSVAGSVTLSCLTYLPGKGFYDSSVSITEGRASAVQETELFKWGRGIFY